MTGSLEATEAMSKAVQKTPNRVTLEYMKSQIAGEYYTTADQAFSDAPILNGMDVYTICMIVMKNGFMIVGKSAPADPENFDRALGQKFAYEDAIRQLWPLEAFALRERMSA